MFRRWVGSTGGATSQHIRVATVEMTVVPQEGRATHKVQGGRGGGAGGSTGAEQKVARKILRALRWLDSAGCHGSHGWKPPWKEQEMENANVRRPTQFSFIH